MVQHTCLSDKYSSSKKYRYQCTGYYYDRNRVQVECICKQYRNNVNTDVLLWSLYIFIIKKYTRTYCILLRLQIVQNNKQYPCIIFFI